MKKSPVLLLPLLLISLTTFAQKQDLRYPEGKATVPFGIIETLDSKALGEKRTLNIYLPDGYNPTSKTAYPVIYLLDGSAHEDYPHIAGLVQFLHMYELIPKSILVGIANVDRYRDFSFPSRDSVDVASLPTSGGGEAFLNFLEEELQPFIKNRFHTKGPKTIIGQSMGGLIATEILMKRPQLFDDYIIVSPSLWWDQQSLVKTADDYFKKQGDLEKRVFVSLGTEHPVMHQVADMLVDAIKNSGNEKMTVFYEPILEEDHATILHMAVYKAFRILNQKSDKKH